MKGRQLPRTTTIVQQENNALKNKVKCLEESLQSAHTDIQQLMEENKKLKSAVICDQFEAKMATMGCRHLCENMTAKAAWDLFQEDGDEDEFIDTIQRIYKYYN